MTTLPPLSVLDLSIVGEGQTTADALRASTEAAQAAESLGYLRYWVAEHHNFPAVASTSPPVLMGHLAANTSTIAIGSGGIMLPNHSPLVIAEQFTMLEALHPGRINLGIGRAPGTDGHTAVALRRNLTKEHIDDFPGNVLDVMSLLGDVRHDDALSTRVSATPAATTSPSVFLLGSSTYSAQLAAMLGLPFSFAAHFAAESLHAALDVYRRTFKPSAVLAEPYAIVAVACVVADTDDEALELSMPGRLMTVDLRRNELRPLRTVEAAMAHPERQMALAMTPDRYSGSAETVMRNLEALVESTAADEIMVTTVTHGLPERLRSMELLANAWHTRAVNLATVTPT